MVSGDISDAFSSKRLLAFDELLTSKDEGWGELNLTTNTEYLQLSNVVKPDLIDLQTELLELQISHEELQDFQNKNPAQEIATSPSSGDNLSQASTDAEVDIWALEGTVPQTAPNSLLSWDRFTHPEAVDRDPKLITETTVREFDRFQSELYRNEQDQALQIAKNNPFQQALANLVFGRSSAFFVWNIKTFKFDLTVEGFAVSGYSKPASARICEYFSASGSRYRRLQEYSRDVRRSDPIQYAFQRSLERLLLSLESHSSVTRTDQARCMLMLKEVEKMVELLSALEHLKTLLGASKSETDFITIFVSEVDKIWLANDHLRPVLAALVSNTIRPAMHQTYGLIGIQFQTKLRHDNEVWLFARLLPDLEKLVVDVKATLSSSSGLELSLLQGESHRNVPICLAHSWDDVIRLHESADTIEKKSRMTKPDVGISTAVHFSNKTSEGLDAFPDPFLLDLDFTTPKSLSLAVNAEDDQRLDVSISKEAAHLMSGKAIDNLCELSPMQAIRLSVQPFIEMQNRLTSFAVMKVLFIQHDLEAHLDILNAFFAFGSHAFATRLVTALFDSDQDNIEGIRKSGLNGGLRLEDREAWPPASSELRLALNDILTEAMQTKYHPRILDCVSFSIKDLSDDEAELCRNIHSIHALDFLRLSYIPHDALLEGMITSKHIEKYDRIFNFVLILLRVHSLCHGLKMRVVKSDSRPYNAVYSKFCLEANHFVTTLLDYVMHNATYMPWRAFKQRIGVIHHHVEANDYQRTMDTAKSISQLCQDYNDVLENMLKGLMLKRRHGKAFQLLCDMLNLFLKSSSDLKNVNTGARIKTMYETFRQLRLEWYRAVEEICNSTGDPALHRLQILLLQIDLSGALGLSKRIPADDQSLSEKYET